MTLSVHHPSSKNLTRDDNRINICKKQDLRFHRYGEIVISKKIVAAALRLRYHAG